MPNISRRFFHGTQARTLPEEILAVKEAMAGEEPIDD